MPLRTKLNIPSRRAREESDDEDDSNSSTPGTSPATKLAGNTPNHSQIPKVSRKRVRLSVEPRSDAEIEGDAEEYETGQDVNGNDAEEDEEEVAGLVYKKEAAMDAEGEEGGEAFQNSRQSKTSNSKVILPFARDDGGAESETGWQEEGEEDKEKKIGAQAQDPDAPIQIGIAENYDDDDSDDGLGDIYDPKAPEAEVIEHKPGAIVRVHMINFVTYTDVVFHPGPSLNMVIGPNGTGKSTLVCAICIGLGYSPSNLGRTKEVSEFVKNGNNEATIEIELMKRPVDEMNFVFTRKIRRDGSSDYQINGKKASARAVIKLTTELSIQINNLCQFLPQDKVAEFAALTPVDLLKETQRAVAPPQVLMDHEELKDMRKKEIKLEIGQASDRESLITAEARQRILERDVERLREREAIQGEIRLLKDAMVFRELDAAKRTFDKAKEEWRLAKESLKGLEREQAPVLEQINQAAIIKQQAQKWMDEKRKQVNNAEKRIKEMRSKGIEKLKEDEKHVDAQKQAARDAEQRRKRELETFRNTVARLAKELEVEPEEVNLKAFNSQIEEAGKVLRRLRTELDEKQATLLPIDQKVNALNMKHADITNEIRGLNNQFNQRIQLLQRFNPDAGKVLKWLRSNGDKFRTKIFGPPMVECNVKDQKYADAVESCFNPNILAAFTCCTQEDYFKFQRAVYGGGGEPGLDVREVSINLCTTKYETQREPCSREQLQAFGFDGWMADYLDGPPEILSMLCEQIGTKRTAIALQQFSEAQHKAIEQSSNLGKYVSGQQVVSITRRAEYGDAGIISSTSSTRIAKSFKKQTVDPSRRTALERQKHDIEQEIESLKQQAEDIGREYKDLQQEAMDLKKEKDQILNEKNKRQEQAKAFLQKQHRLKDIKGKIVEKEIAGEGYKENLFELENRHVAFTAKRVKACIDYANSISELVQWHNDLVEGELQLLEALSNHEKMSNRSEEIQQTLQQKRSECEALKEEGHRQGGIAGKKKADARVIMDRLSDEDKAFVGSMNSKSPDDLQIEIQGAVNRLDLIHEGDPTAIKQFEKRQVEIDALKRKMEATQIALDEIRTHSLKVRQRWEPHVDKLIGNISDAFSKSFEFMGCAGHVQVYKEGFEYDKWAVQIMVTFRESESMQILTAQRQSGGERAVSTVFYLMALQALARAPFRVVDEINQGMDPRNERLVHKRMVKIACRQHTSQYFLITPKLLVDLDYHERMKVLCIHSGDYVEENHIVNMDRYFAAGQALMASA